MSVSKLLSGVGFVILVFSMIGSVVAQSNEYPPNSLNLRQQSIHRILNQEHQGQLSSVRTLQQLVLAMRDLGLPVFVDISATDDSWDDSALVEPIESNLSIYEVVQLELQRYNAAMAMVGNKLMIISKDVDSDPEFFTRIVYDLGAFRTNEYGLGMEIRTVIAADSWDDTNGDGVLIVRKGSGGRNLLIVNQSYAIHREIQEYLRSLARIESTVVTRSVVVTSGGSTASKVIRVPSDSDSTSLERFNRELNRAGLKAGGVFSVRD